MWKICHKVPSYLSFNCMGDPIGFSYPQNITCVRQLTFRAVYFLVHYIWFIYSCLPAELIQWLTWTKDMCYMFLASKHLFLDLPFRFGIGAKARVCTLASVSCYCICWITLIWCSFIQFSYSDELLWISSRSLSVLCLHFACKSSKSFSFWLELF
jgi:hypothetical protein